MLEKGLITEDLLPDFVYVCPFCGSRSCDIKARYPDRKSPLCSCFLPLELAPDGTLFLEADPSDFGLVLSFMRRGVLDLDRVLGDR